MKRFILIYALSFGLVLLLAAGCMVFFRGDFVLNSPAHHEAVNEVGEPLAIGEEWQESNLFTLKVSSVTERAWNEPEFALESYEKFRLQNYRIYDICFEYGNLNYSGYEQNGKRQMGLFFDVFGVGYNALNEKIMPIPLDAHTTGLFRSDDFGELGSGMKVEDNHYIVFAKPEVSAIAIHFTTYIDDTEHTLEKNYEFDLETVSQ